MKKTSQYIITAGLYLIVLATILYLFPLQHKLGYYFQKNKPWQYENLIAPFDFPIYKTEDQIKAEKDSLTSHFFPYVEKKQGVEKQVLDKITSATNNFFAGSNDEKTKKFLIEFYDFTSHLIDSVYNPGIISEHDKKKIGKDTVTFISGAYLRKLPVSKLLTPKSASKICKEKIKEFVNKSDITGKNRLINELNIERYIVPDVFYNATMTEKELNNLLSTVSSTTGMVQKGELIIAKGELVNEHKLQILNSLKKEYESKVISHHINRVLGGYAIMLVIALLINFIFIEFRFRNQAFVLHILSLLMILLFGAFTFLAVKYSQDSIYLIPFTLIPIIFRAFYDEETAILSNTSILLLLSILAPHPYEFLFYNLSAGIIVVFAMRNFVSRSHFIRASLYAFLVYSFLFTAFNLIRGNSLFDIDFMRYAYFAVNSIFLLLSYSLIYVIERTFGLLSDISLVELSNTNKPLLRQLSEEAPGTFQHSIQVANLAYEVATKIGANALLVKTGAFYHDIGKLYNPDYFTENQHGKFNPHEKLSPLQSASIIVGHVTKGVELAKKHKLPNQIIDFIKTHHGTSRVEYFYRKYQQENPDKEIKEELFRYPGPKPFSKETAILMMCDAIEAASRSLDEYTPETIGKLVDKIIDNQFKNGQFDDSTLTLQDISTAKALLKVKLQNIYHTRVKYPD